MPPKTKMTPEQVAEDLRKRGIRPQNPVKEVVPIDERPNRNIKLETVRPKAVKDE